MPHAPGITDELTDRFAQDLYTYTARSEAEALGITGDDLTAWKSLTWPRSNPALHALFRERAERMIAGDLSVLPETRPIGTFSSIALPVLPAPAR